MEKQRSENGGDELLTARITRTGALPQVARQFPVGPVMVAFSAVVVVFIIIIVFAATPKIDWSYTEKYLFHRRILQGVVQTILLTIVGQMVATLVGFGIALGSQSANPSMRICAAAYVWFFRSVPLLVLLLLFFNVGLLLPDGVFSYGAIHVHLPFDLNEIVSGFSASVAALALHQSAYMAEIFRGGILSVPLTQRQAGLTLGMTHRQMLIRVVFPQMIRSIIPPMTNRMITLLKETSLVAVIGGGDLLTEAQNIYSRNFAVVPLLAVAGFWYLVLVSAATLGQRLLERKLDVGS